MAAPRNLEQYPSEWRGLIRKVHELQEVELVFPTSQQANSAKTRFYNFFKALRKYRDEYKNTQLKYGRDKANENDIDQLYDLSLQADEIKIITIDTTLKLSLRKNDDLTKLIVAALGLQPEGHREYNPLESKFIQSQLYYETTLEDGTVIKFDRGMTIAEVVEFSKINYGRPMAKESIVEQSLSATEKNNPETVQEVTESTNWDEAIAQATGTDKRRLKRFKRLAEKRVEFFGKKGS